MAEREQQEYPVSFITKEDLVYSRPDLEPLIAALGETDMTRIADKLGDALTDIYWDALGIILDGYLPITPPLDEDDPLKPI